jgi:hypothetical protein
LRLLARRLNIAFRSLDHKHWPAAHVNTFKEIQGIATQRFDNFNVDSIDTTERPWKRQIKHRAELLAMRARNLLGQRRNEAGWRFAMENGVLHRFHVEVSW